MQTGAGMLCVVMSAASYVLAVLQLREKGPLINNAYLYASAQERKTMNKKPHYRQSGVVFSMTGTIFALLALEAFTGWEPIGYAVAALLIIVLAYAVVSCVRIRRD